MNSSKNVPTQLQEVIAELIKNWEPITKIEITPVFEELEYWDQWFLRVTIRDFSFRFPWKEEITVAEVSNFYGYIFRRACYAVESAILHGVTVGSELYKKSFFQSINSIVDAEAKKSINEFRNKH